MSRYNVNYQLANAINHESLIAGTAAGVGPSPAIWASCPYLPMMFDPSKGFVYFNDFLNAAVTTTADAAVYDGLVHTERTQGSISNAPTIPGGIVVLDAGATTADTGITAQLLGCQCEPASGTTIYMEWRCMINVGGGQMFMGLCNDDTTAIVSSSDAIVTTKDLVGFYRDTGTGDTDWTVGVCDGSSSDEKDDAVSGASESAYEKFGIVLRGIGAVAGSTAEFYHNGVLKYVLGDTADLPLLLMCPVFQADGDGTDRPYIYLDWLRVAVSHVNGKCREGA
jgi:hypothetical protein